MRPVIHVRLLGKGKKRPWIAKALGIDINSKYGIRRVFLPVIIKTKNVYFFEIVEQGLYEIQEPFQERTYWHFTPEDVFEPLTPERFFELLPLVSTEPEPEPEFEKPDNLLNPIWMFVENYPNLKN